MKNKRSLYILGGIICAFFLVLINWKGISKRLFFSDFRAKYACFISAKNINKGIVPLDSMLFCQFELSHDLDRGGVWSEDQDVTHPSVVRVDGMTWIALTPYPQALDLKGEPYENACVFYSEEVDAPAHIFKSIKRNPVIFKGEAKYNSDCDLFFDVSDSLFYLVNRKRHLPHIKTQIVMQSSRDGNEWSEPVVLFETNRETLCPCLVKVDSIYKIFAFNSKDQATMCDNTEVWVSSSLVDPQFSLEGIYPWTNQNISIWHGDVVYDNGMYYMTSCGINNNYTTKGGGKDHYKYLWFGSSTDGLTWNFNPNPVIKANGVYRSTFYFEENNVVFYTSFHQRFYDDYHHAGNKVGVVRVPLDKLTDY